MASKMDLRKAKDRCEREMIRWYLEEEIIDDEGWQIEFAAVLDDLRRWTGVRRVRSVGSVKSAEGGGEERGGEEGGEEDEVLVTMAGVTGPQLSKTLKELGWRKEYKPVCMIMGKRFKDDRKDPDFRYTMDPRVTEGVLRYAREEMVRVEDAVVPFISLYREYEAWCALRGVGVCGSKVFGIIARRDLGIEKGMQGGLRVYKGVTTRSRLSRLANAASEEKVEKAAE
jgi:hypothetical protein